MPFTSLHFTYKSLLSKSLFFNMLQYFSLVYSYMLGLLRLARCDLGLSDGLAGHCHSEASDVCVCVLNLLQLP